MKKLLVFGLAVLMLLSFGTMVNARTTLVYGTTEKVIDMDPANAYDFHTWEIFYNIYQGLYKYKIGETTLVQAWPNLTASAKTAKNTPLNSEMV